MLFYIALYAHMKLFLSAKYLEVKMLDTGYVIFKKIYLLVPSCPLQDTFTPIINEWR